MISPYFVLFPLLLPSQTKSWLIGLTFSRGNDMSGVRHWRFLDAYNWLDRYDLDRHIIDFPDSSCWCDGTRFSFEICSSYMSCHHPQYLCYMIHVGDSMASSWCHFWVLLGSIRMSSRITIGLNDARRTSRLWDNIRPIQHLNTPFR